MIKLLIILSLLVGTISSAPKKSSASSDQSNPLDILTKSLEELKSTYRLPKSVIPKVYVLEFDPDFLGETFTFDGKAKIHLEVRQTTSTITMHKAGELQVKKKSVNIVDENGKVIKPSSFKWSPENEFYKLTFDKKLKRGYYTLNMEWKGLDGAMSWWNLGGFYRAVDDTDEKNKYMVTTHFEPDGARTAFPCWDEPGLKAQFEIALKHFPNYTAISNMPVKSTENSTDGKVLTKFERSVKMSPYLPCWAIANYKKIENSAGNVTFYTLPDKLELVRHALEVSEKVLPAMNEYTQVPYALPKLDQITVPQYGAVAMEHWGLVSYVTSYMQLKNTTLIPNLRVEDQITSVVAHELAHQWFGNLVSPKWWNDAWLNEAFANYYQYKIIDMMYPEWNHMDYFAVKDLNEQVFPFNKSSKPIRWMSKTKADLERMFSQVTYAQGGAVVHMLDHLLTRDVFRNGIRKYMKAHQFTAVETDDLWDDLQEAYDEAFPKNPLNIKKTMDPWIEQVGFPVVTVERDYEKKTAKLTQRNINKKFPENKWRIPITFATKSNPDFSLNSPTTWMEPDEPLMISDIEKDDWIIVNNQQRGLYLVEYDEENWNKLIKYLHSNEFKKIHPINRAQLIYDATRMAEDPSKLPILLNLASYLAEETNPLPWIPAGSLMEDFSEKMHNTPEEETFHAYMLYLLSGVMDHVGFTYLPDEDYDTSRIRYMLMPYACTFHHAECRKNAHKLLNTYLANPSEDAFPEDDWNWVLCNGLRVSNDSVWEMFLSDKLPLPKNVHGSKFEFFKCAPTSEAKKKYLDSAWSANSNYDAENVYDMITSFLTGTHSDVDFILDYIIENFDTMEKFFDEKNEDFNMLLVILRQCFSVKCQNQYDKWKAFLEPRLEKLNKKYGDDTVLDAYKAMDEVLQDSLEFSKKFHDLMDDKLGLNKVITDNKGK